MPEEKAASVAAVAPPPPPPLVGAGESSPKSSAGKSPFQDNPFASSIRSALKQRVAVGIGAGVLVLLGIGYYAISSSRGGILVQDTSPDLTIQLNGQAVNAKTESKGKFIPAYPGVYRLTLTRPNYQPVVIDVTLSRGETVGVRPAYTVLPNTKETAISTIDFVHPSEDEASIMYLGDDRQTLYRFDIGQGLQIPLTDVPLQNVDDVEWSSDPTVALMVQGGNVNLHEIPKYDFSNQITVRVAGSELESPVWDPTNNARLAAGYFPSTGEKSLVFTDRRLTQIYRKADLTDLTNPKLVWAGDANHIALVNRSGDAATNDLWIYTTSDGTLNKVTTGGNVLDASFSPDGSTLLYESASTDSSNPFHASLTVAKSDGSGQISLNVPGQISQATWKDNSSFYLPDPNHQILELYSLDGKHQDVPYALTDTSHIQGMHYFPKDKQLIFYTHQAIYTLDLSQ